LLFIWLLSVPLNVFPNKQLFVVFSDTYVSTWKSVAGHFVVNFSYSEFRYVM